MADTPPAPASLLLVETGPDSGWCDAATGICTAFAADPEGPLSESEDTTEDM
ncbi:MULTISPECIES: hypothetical protein [Streptomyces]|uniref:Uncharacterized protein n=1 Tax=Streptomyces sp. NBC_00093 TaxID=2975649 RepID=A0AAU2A1S8_9ACTN